MCKVTEIFGSMVFDDRVMRSVLNAETYEELSKTITLGQKLNPSVADAVAAAMRDWAVAKGATHYTHWFQPLTGITAEKHDSFISQSPDGRVIMDFSGKELIKGEPDASSFPNGGLRSTFEARGYTAWDPTSYAFVKGKTLYIPTAFCSYSSEALDEKTPLLRSMEALNKEAVRVLRCFGDKETKSIRPMVGAEQEYFLIDKAMYMKRPDLVITGRTLLGAVGSKGQELEDHYFGVIRPRVQAFMDELNDELWKLGILAKTEHNEVAPRQHELACIYTVANVAIDQNQIVMETMKRIAPKYDLVCLLHEKPFEGVNGSGKHNNWSLCTDKGVNLLSPGDTPYENAQFLLFLCAIIKAVDEYQDILRISVATAGNDHRLGADEAPPAVVSIFLGDELTQILEAIENKVEYSPSEAPYMEMGAHALPRFLKDRTDRNRTSPFAFTGNKFEFRMPGSGSSIAAANIMLNTAVASELKNFANELGNTADMGNVYALIRNTYHRHKRIVFNGNGYDSGWIDEAKSRGLLNLATTPEALKTVMSEKNIRMLTEMGTFTESEIRCRYETRMENYCKTLIIEANTIIGMIREEILPAIDGYIRDMAQTVGCVNNVSGNCRCEYQVHNIERLGAGMDRMDEQAGKLEKILYGIKGLDYEEKAEKIRTAVIPLMKELRDESDRAEINMSKRAWPYPTYNDLLFIG